MDGLIAVQRAESVCRGLGRGPARAALLSNEPVTGQQEDDLSSTMVETGRTE